MEQLRAANSWGSPCYTTMQELLTTLEGQQKPDDRLVTAKALHALLDPASATYGGDDAVDAFLAQGGPSILRYRLDSMDGDWMVEARNGTTDLIDTIARLPGLQKTFDKVSLIKDDHVTIARRELHQMAHPEECADQACAVEHRSPEGRGVAGLVSQRPGNAPRGTLHVVELHEQLKNVIEK